jgi:hypothetical protein
MANKYAFTLFLFGLVASTPLLAGVPQTTMDCKSTSGNFTISGYPEGEGFDLKLKSGDAVIRYTNMCDGTECPEKENYGNVTVVDALFNKVFTISFANSENNNRGMFYAIPNSVQYKKDSHGYHATYQGIYWGDDPTSKEAFKEFVKAPGISLSCTQKNEL